MTLGLFFKWRHMKIFLDASPNNDQCTTKQIYLHRCQTDNEQLANIFHINFLFQIAEDDKILPGVEGKIVVWVEEE